MAGAGYGAGRYIRRGVAVDTRGTSHYPLPEPVDEPYDLNAGDRTPTENLSPSSSSSSSPRDAAGSDVAQSVRTASVWSDTGNNTERGSVDSLNEDEFDRQESQKVQELFDNLDLMLFDDCVSGPSHLHYECKQWTSTFPHLRIVGTNVYPSKDLGYQLYPGSDSASQRSSVLLPSSSSSDYPGLDLVVRGKPLGPGSSSACASSSSRPPSNHSGESFPSAEEEEEEELIQTDGILEEYFAVDYGDDDLNGPSRQPWWTSLMPVTPSACLRNNIEQDIFSKLWTEVVYVLDPLIRRYWEMIREDVAGGQLKPLPSEFISHEARQLLNVSRLNREHSQLGASRLLVMPEKFSRQASVLSTCVSSPSSVQQLNGLLTISTKALQTRDKNSLHDADLSLGISQSVTRPGSSLTPLSGRATLKIHERLLSAKTRPIGRTKLAPILGAEYSKTPFADDDHQPGLSHEVLRGFKMTTITEKQVSTPRPGTAIRNPGPLPPIGRELTYDSISSTNNNNNNRRIYGRTAFGEKISSTSTDSRPSTSNALSWSEGPLMLAASRRSSTTVGFSNHSRNYNALSHSDSAVIGNRRLTVTGNNVGFSSLSSSHATDILIPEIEDDDVPQTDQGPDAVSRQHKGSPPYRRFISGHHVIKNIEGSGSRRPSNARFNAPVR